MSAETSTRPVPASFGRHARGAAILAPALAVPDRVVGNEIVADALGIDPSWITRRTGIDERRFVEPGEDAVSLAAQAGRRSLDSAGMHADELDLLLVATSTHTMIVPSAAALVAGRLGCRLTATMDVGAACTGWLSALALAAAQIECGRAQTALVIGVDVISPIIDPQDRSTAPLFADGAGAVVLMATEAETRIGPVRLGVEPDGAHLVTGTHEEGILRMVGQETFASAVEHLCRATQSALEAAGRGIADVDVFAYHQANARILQAVGRRLELDPSRVINTVSRFGNTSAGTIPITLAIGAQDGRIQDGDVVLLGAFGAGFTWGAAVVKWGR